MVPLQYELYITADTRITTTLVAVGNASRSREAELVTEAPFIFSDLPANQRFVI